MTTRAMNFDCHVKKHRELVGINILVLCSGYDGFFLEQTKEVFKVHGVWYSPNMLPTIVRGRAFRIITWRHSTSRGLPLSAIGGCICGSRSRVNIKILNTIPIKIWWQKGTIIIDEGYFVIYHWFHIKMYK